MSSSIIQSGITRRTWTCDQCGKVGHWDNNWHTWGSLAEEDYDGRRLVICSDACRDACKPLSLWRKKYGCGPRKFRTAQGGYVLRVSSRTTEDSSAVEC